LIGHEDSHGHRDDAFAIPVELKSLFEHPLLAGESRRDFEFTRNMIINEIRPESFIEWLWTFDLVELCWEILRYLRFKMRLLDALRAAAIESLLVLVDGEDPPDQARPMVHSHVRKARADWRNDPKSAAREKWL
jgi:hypothetical protein